MLASHFRSGGLSWWARIRITASAGLVRAQFDVVHQWCAERGLLVQGITGIPYYYRQFGYEMALNLSGGRNGYKVHVPKLAEGEEEPYIVRPAQEADLPFIVEFYKLGNQRWMVSCVRDAAYWRYELCDMSAKNVNRFELRIIQAKDGEAVGFLAHPHFTWGPVFAATTYELKPGVSWGAVTPSVVRYLYATGEAIAAQDGKQAEFDAFSLNLAWIIRLTRLLAITCHGSESPMPGTCVCPICPALFA